MLFSRLPYFSCEIDKLRGEGMLGIKPKCTYECNYLRLIIIGPHVIKYGQLQQATNGSPGIL